MAEVFISYASEDRAIAEMIARALSNAGLSVWWDRHIEAGVRFNAEIKRQLQAAHAVVVLWSAASEDADWVHDEAQVGRDANKLIPVRIDSTLPPLGFRQVQSLDMKGWNGEPNGGPLVALLSAFQRIVGGARTDVVNESRSTVTPPFPKASAAADPLPSEPLLAVLAFDNLSGDAEMIYFSDGVSEEIQQTVARSNGLKVIGRGSSFSFRGADKAASNVAKQLRATHVLDGSVRRSGSRVRISAQLVACDSDTMLWSDRFDRELTDIFALQDEIAAAVSAALKTTLASPSRPQSIDPDVYDLYLKARASSIWTTTTHRGREQMLLERLTMLERVVEAAPGFARAWASVAWDRAFYLRNFDRSRVPGLNRGSVVEAAENALRLDPGAGVAYLALSRLEPWGHYLARETKRRQGLAALPNDPFALIDLAWFCGDVGRNREALDYAKRAWELDPMEHRAADAYASALDELGKFVESRALWDQFRVRWPNVRFESGAIRCAALEGDWVRFDALVRAAEERGVNVQMNVEYHRNVRALEPRYVGETLRRAQDALARTGRVPLQLLAIASQLGMIDTAFELIDRASFAHLFDPDGASPTEGIGPGVELIFYRENRRMMQDIRFVGFCAKLGLCDYWVKTDRWPDCADDVAYDFKHEARRLQVQS